MKITKRIGTILLSATLMAGVISMPTFAAQYDRETVTYKDSRGNDVTIVGGADSCATRVVSFTPGASWTSVKGNQDPNSMLGAPDDYNDTGSGSNGTALTMGNGGVIVLEFSVDIVDGEGNDIYVFEMGPDVEATKVEVSDDCENWIYVGDAKGSISGVDLNGKVPANGLYHYVRITDLGTAPSGRFAGADIDAVAIINSKASPFKDIPAKEYYFTPATWAFNNDITTGVTTTKFVPNEGCTRAMAVTFLWRIKGSPASSLTSLPFKDIDTTAYYYDALKWGYENGVITGFKPTVFGPNRQLTRAQFVTMIHRLEGNPSYSTSNPFVDIAGGEYYYDAVLWALENGVTTGMDSAHFAPDKPCLRAQVVTFLYRKYGK